VKNGAASKVPTKQQVKGTKPVAAPINIVTMPQSSGIASEAIFSAEPLDDLHLIYGQSSRLGKTWSRSFGTPPTDSDPQKYSVFTTTYCQKLRAEDDVVLMEITVTNWNWRPVPRSCLFQYTDFERSRRNLQQETFDDF
jgi:hypothetical protein